MEIARSTGGNWRSGSARRLVLGFCAAVAAPIAIVAVATGPFWVYILPMGVIFAIAPLLLAEAAFFVLYGLDQLRVWWAVLIGAIVAAPIPILIAPNAASYGAFAGLGAMAGLVGFGFRLRAPTI